MKNPKFQIQTLTLPDHILADEILPRLPLKSLLRFKSVCKHWLSIISSYRFAKSCLKFSTSCSQQVFILTDGLLQRPGFFFVLNFNGQHCNVVKQSAFEDDRRITILELVGSSNGLVCLFVILNHHEKFCLWNPTTHQSRFVPKPDNYNDIVSKNGFGYVSSKDDYKIIALFLREGVVCVFSWKTGKWRTISFSEEWCQTTSGVREHSVMLDDCAYWIVCECEGTNIVSGIIVRFDFDSELIIEFLRMNWLNDYDYLPFSMKLFVMNGCLSLCCPNIHGTTDVWMLKPCNTWEKLFSLGDKHLFLYHVFGNGKCLVIDEKQCRGNLYSSFCVEGQKLRVIDPTQEEDSQHSQDDVHFPYIVMRAVNYVESLVSPFGKGWFDDEDEFNCGIELSNNDE